MSEEQTTEQTSQTTEEQTTTQQTTETVATPTEATNPLVGLSAELLGNERLKDVKSVEDLANRLVNAKFAPEIPKPDGYTLPEGVPAEVGQFAHDNSLTQAQLDKVLGEMARLNEARTHGQLQTLYEQGQDKLKEWGDNAKEYTKLAVDAVAYFEEKNPGLKKMLKETGYGNHPQILEVFREVGNMLKESGFVKSENYTPANKKTQAQRMFPTQAALEK